MPDREAELLAVLGEIQARGSIGDVDLTAAIHHAGGFVAGIPDDAQTVADLGSGGGLPGLVIALRRPELTIVLVERRTTRADMLRRAVARLGLDPLVTVHAADVERLARMRSHEFDVVTARSFAAPVVALRWASELLRPGGTLLVSEPPHDDPQRWRAADLQHFAFTDLGRHQGIRHFSRS